MSDFSKYLLFQRAAEPGALLARLGVTGIVVPNRDPWLLVVSTAHERVRDESPLVLEVDYAADHGLYLGLFARGHRVAKLTAESEVGRRASFEPAPWVKHGLLKPAGSQAITRLLARDDWHHEDVRDVAAKRLGFRAESFLRPEDLETRRDELRRRFPDAVFVRDGAPAPWVEDHVDIDLAEIDAILEAERRAPVRRVKPPPPVEVVSAAEMADLSRSFRAVRSLAVESAQPSGPEVDLAACTTARAWLDARSRVVPEHALPAVLRELERVVREGRFEGDAAVVVREAAAMLLARCLAAQRGAESEAWLTAQRDAASSEAERSAWDTALARWLTAKR